MEGQNGYLLGCDYCGSLKVEVWWSAQNGSWPLYGRLAVKCGRPCAALVCQVPGDYVQVFGSPDVDGVVSPR